MNHNISRMNLEHLKTFHYVALYGSFTQAANSLFLTQPAVSQQIQGLENSLRVQLFDRSKKKILLTPEGEILFSYTERLFGLFSEIEHVFQDLNHLQTGTLSIATSAVMGTYYLPDILARFSKRYPLIHFKILMGNSQQVADWVCNMEADIGLAGRVPNQPHLHQVLLHREPYACVVGAQSPLLRLRRALTTDEFLNAFMIMREKGTRTRAKIEEWFKDHSIHKKPPVPLITVSNLESAKRLLANGLGAMALPYLAVADEMANGSLVSIPVENFQVNADYYLTYLANRQFSVAALQFLMLLKETSNADFHNQDIAQIS